MKTVLLIVSYVMMIGGGLFLGVLLYFAIPVLWRERKSERERAARAPRPEPKLEPKPEPPPFDQISHRAPPPTRNATPEEAFDGALCQALQRGFDRWWQSRNGTCPGCLQPTFVVAPQRDRRSLSTNTGHGFTYWTQDLSCATCGWNATFLHTDAGPAEAHALTSNPRLAPVRRWTIAGDAETHPAGTITAGGGQPLVVETHPAASGRERLRLSIAAQLLDEVADAVAPDLEPALAETIFGQATGSLMSMHGCGARSVERVTPEAPALSAPSIP